MKTEQELIEKLDKLVQENETAIKNQEYEKAACIRDEIRTSTNLLEEAMNPPIFCNENELAKKIKEEIIPLFLNLDNKELDSTYEYFKTAFELKKEDREEIECGFSLKSFEVVKRDKYQIKNIDTSQLGVDFPIWFNLKDHEPDNIMILGLDPLRSHCFSNDKVWLGTPYALHCSEFRKSAKHTKKYFDFIQQLSKDNGVYITDASKVFYRENKAYEKRSTNSKTFWENKLHFEILQKEIEVIKPKLIITLGATTAHMLSGKRIKITEKINKSLTTYNEKHEGTIALGDTPLLCLSHLSNANNGGINTFLKANDKPSGNAETQVNSYVQLVDKMLENIK
jgi:hypothetical protein